MNDEFFTCFNANWEACYFIPLIITIYKLYKHYTICLRFSTTLQCWIFRCKRNFQLNYYIRLLCRSSNGIHIKLVDHCIFARVIIMIFMWDSICGYPVERKRNKMSKVNVHKEFIRTLGPSGAKHRGNFVIPFLIKHLGPKMNLFVKFQLCNRYGDFLIG